VVQCERKASGLGQDLFISKLNPTDNAKCHSSAFTTPTRHEEFFAPLAGQLARHKPNRGNLEANEDERITPDEVQAVFATMNVPVQALPTPSFEIWCF